MTYEEKRKTGLYPKFNVGRTDLQHLPGRKHYNCDYFVLDLTHDKFANDALAAYATACESEFPKLAADIRIKIVNPPVAEPTVEPEKEWTVTFTILAGHPGVRQSVWKNNSPLLFKTEAEADDCIAGKMDCSPQLYREPQDIRKQWRFKSGPWVDAETKGEA